MRPDSALCPLVVRYEIDEYLKKGVPPSNFVTQVLSNNLKESFMGADENNLEALPHIVCYCYNYVPFAAWGSLQRVREVIEAGGFANYCQLCREAP